MHFGGIFDFDNKSERLEEVVRELEGSAVWDNPERAQMLGRERAQLEAVVHQLQQLGQSITDLTELFEMARMEEDEITMHDVAKEVTEIERQVAKIEFHRMFSGKMDNANAFLDIQSGSGGTEAQDWAEMLLRMYLRWGEQHGFTTELVECSAGEVAGIKSATIHFTGAYAYGWLRTETGVHRLVRISPFDAEKMRHTSFALIEVLPEATEVTCLVSADILNLFLYILRILNDK